ncbi:iron chaperone [Euzebya sp.]|uniref:iron chaperone n=1 Tax=Euzebya sp. TaxID=1971409 RepID=UPI0035158A4E
MKARTEELRAERGGKKKADGMQAVLDAIAEMPDADRVIAERLHALVIRVAPDLLPRTWYGMPAYARGKEILCFFQGADKFDTRYATLGFNDDAALDDGAMWPTAYAITEWDDGVEERVEALLRTALG